jgi:hypothetical protein
MGHNSWHGKVEKVESAQQRETDLELVADAERLIEKWNADIERRKAALYGRTALQQLPQFSPTIRAALRARKPFLRLLCPACRQQGEVDLRKVVRPPETLIMSIYDALVCTTGCRGDSPRPHVIGLFAGRDNPLQRDDAVEL